MNISKKSSAILIVILVIIIAGGFWVWKDNQEITVIEEQGQNQNQQQEGVQDISSNLAEELEIPTGWKLYENKDFGIAMAYPEKNYTIDENSGDIHFYYGDGAAPAGSQQPNYININISKEKNPQGVETLDELFQYNKDNPGVEVKRITKEAEIKTIGNMRFIVNKFYNNDNFFSVSFVAMSNKGESCIVVSFGGYWNTIGDGQYEMIIKIMESFRIIE